ncbi:MAG: lysoplasmalogenase [Chakrabartia sp.]
MPNGSLIKIVLIAAVVAAVSYIASWNMALDPTISIAWKGAGVGLLALYAALQARSLDGWLITAVMAFGALGDVLLDAISMEAGAGAFVIGHILAFWLYVRNWRPQTTGSQRLLAALTAPLTIVIALALVRDPMIGIYAAFVGIMAATAWISRFPRFRTGIGAMMFLASDLLIFARMDALASAAWVGLAIWILYFGGQLLIVLGVTATLSTAPIGKSA